MKEHENSTKAKDQMIVHSGAEYLHKVVSSMWGPGDRVLASMAICAPRKVIDASRFFEPIINFMERYTSIIDAVTDRLLLEEAISNFRLALWNARDTRHMPQAVSAGLEFRNQCFECISQHTASAENTARVMGFTPPRGVWNRINSYIRDARLEQRQESFARLCEKKASVLLGASVKVPTPSVRFRRALLELLFSHNN